MERFTVAKILTVVFALDLLSHVGSIAGLEREAILVWVSHGFRQVEAMLVPTVDRSLYSTGTILRRIHNTFGVNNS